MLDFLLSVILLFSFALMKLFPVVDRQAQEGDAQANHGEGELVDDGHHDDEETPDDGNQGNDRVSRRHERPGQVRLSFSQQNDGH